MLNQLQGNVMLQKIMGMLGYVKIIDAENAAKEIAAAQCRNVQKYALEDFGAPIDQAAESQSRSWAENAFRILLGGGTLPSLVTPSDG